MNKKGITLIELIISISLISIVVIFLFRLFVDVRYNDEKVDYSRNNQQARALIIKAIQEDLLDEENPLTGLNTSGSTSSTLKVNLVFKSGTAQMVVTSKSFSYTNTDRETEKWSLKDDNVTYQITSIPYKKNWNPIDDNFFFIWFRIPVKISGKTENAIDDIDFSYIGKKSEANTTDFPSGTRLN